MEVLENQGLISNARKPMFDPHIVGDLIIFITNDLCKKVMVSDLN